MAKKKKFIEELKEYFSDKYNLSFLLSAFSLFLIFYSLPDIQFFRIIRFLSLLIFTLISWSYSSRNIKKRMNKIEWIWNFYNEIILTISTLLYFLILLPLPKITQPLTIGFIWALFIFAISLIFSTAAKFLLKKIVALKDIVKGYISLVLGIIILFSMIFILLNGFHDNKLNGIIVNNTASFPYTYFSINNFYSASYGDQIIPEGTIMKIAVLAEVIIAAFIHVFVITYSFEKLRK